MENTHVEFRKEKDHSIIRIKDCDENIHNRWNNQLSPVARVNEGDIVIFECRNGSDGQISDKSTTADLMNVDKSRVHALTGPVYIEGAESGDSLEVQILEVEPRHDYGFTSLQPGAGVIFSDPYAGVLEDKNLQGPYLRIWKLNAGRASFENGVSVPIRPFMGVMGVAPSWRGEFRTLSPFETGGNIDVKQLVKGSSVFFPVLNRGALFSTGDGHAAQGDGEVCVTAIEIAAEFTCKFIVHKNANITRPRALIPPQNSEIDDKGYYLTMGIDRDVNKATRDAVREMIDWIAREQDLSLRDAYVVTSVAGDLKISQAVDAPNWTISFTLPRSIFLSK
jgi:acetamidase/formamidase